MILFLSLISSLNAQNKLGFNFDYAQFGYDSTSNYVEFYYSFQQNDMFLMKKDSSFYVSAKINLFIQNKNNTKVIINKQWILNRIILDTTKSGINKSLVGVIAYIIPIGTYTLKISAEEYENSNFKKEYTEKLNVLPFYGEDVMISDIQLATNIKKENVNEKSMFYKNTLEVIPNPAILYTNKSPVLFYYAEVYNLKTHSFNLHKIVFNSIGDVVYSTMQQVITKNNSVVQVGVINLKKFPTDTYNLSLEIIDTVSHKRVVSTKKFFLFNPNIKNKKTSRISSHGYMSSEFAVYSPKECDELFEQSKYIANENEIDSYDRLDSLSAKREFLYKFWKRRDPILSTQKNEFKIEYFKRIKYCNDRFSTLKRKGYKTDRGRIYLLYGAPDQIDRFPNEVDLKPYEIWRYNSIEGGVFFVFADLTGYSNYELIHSTKRGEIRDDNWQRRISIR